MMPEPATDTLLPTRQSLLGRLHDLQDQTAWREFFDSYWRLIYKVARSTGLGDSEAQDVAQNTFIYLSRRMPNFRYDPARGAFKSWLRVVTRSRISVFRRQQKVDEKFRRETTEEIYYLKRQLLEVKRAVSPLTEVCNRLMRFDLTLIPEDTRPYFRDIYDHVLRINELVDNARDLLSTALDANFSLISISQNDVSKRFAGWAAIIGVPTMIAGIYGMNFKAMPELQWRYGYPVVLTLTIGSCILLYVLFKRSGWL